MTDKVIATLSEIFTDATGTVFPKDAEIVGVREKTGIRIAAGVSSMKENFVPWEKINEKYLMPSKKD